MIEVGQKLWFVPMEKRQAPREVEVLSIGRKWATLSGMHSRLDVATMRMEPTGYGYGRDGDVYLSEGDYLRARERLIAWAQLRADLDSLSHPPRDVETRHIIEARKVLGLP